MLLQRRKYIFICVCRKAFARSADLFVYLKVTSGQQVWIRDTRKARQLAHALLKGNVSWIPSFKTSKNPSILKDVREPTNNQPNKQAHKQTTKQQNHIQPTHQQTTNTN